MAGPVVTPRVEQSYKLACLGIERANIASLPGIATETRKSEITDLRTPAVLATNEVIDLMRRIRIVLMKQAVFAPMPSAFRDAPAQGFA